MAKWIFVIMALIATCARAGEPIPYLPDVQYFDLMNPFSNPLGITTGPGGEIWFTDDNGDRIGRIMRDGQIDEFPLRGPLEPSIGPGYVIVGPDGNIWFTETEGTPAIGRMTPDGNEVDHFPVPSFGRAIDIANGPLGTVWFTKFTVLRSREAGSAAGELPGAVGRVTSQGIVKEFVTGYPSFGITQGPDEAMWFTSTGIARIDVSGNSQLFPFEGSPTGITTGPDGALWFVNIPDGPSSPNGAGGSAGLPVAEWVVGRMTTDGSLTKFYLDEPVPSFRPERIIRGPEDNLWFTTFNGGIWRINVAGTLKEYLPLSENEYAADLTAGADGRIWFTQPNTARIGRLESLVFDAAGPIDVQPVGLARGPDDSIWFADYSNGRVGRMPPDNVYRTYNLNDGGTPTAVAVAPDGLAWFTNPAADTIGHVTDAGDVDEMPIPNSPSTPLDIVLGPDGHFWFTEYDAGAIGRVTRQGAFARFSVPLPPDVLQRGLLAPRSRPVNIAVGPDGNLWFTDEGLNRIGRLTTGGVIDTFPIPTEDSGPAGIAAGGDGNLYFVESNSGRPARVTIAGEVTELGIPDVDSFPNYITLGPDGAMWFTEQDSNRLGRIAPDGRITKFELPEITRNNGTNAQGLSNVDSIPTGIVGRGDRLFVGLLGQSMIAFTDLAAAEPTRTATNTPTRTRTPTVTTTPTRTRTATATPNVPATTATRTATSQLPTATPTDAVPVATATRTRTATRTPTTGIGDPTATATEGSTENTPTPSEQPLLATPTPTAPDGEPTETETPNEQTPEPTETETVSCAGDCDGSQAVSISELITAVNIALGTRGVDDCLTADTDGDGFVRVNELVSAVGRALRGC